MQRIIPKNLVLWAAVVFKVLEIIRTPAISTSKNNIAAVKNSVCAIELFSMS